MSAPLLLSAQSVGKMLDMTTREVYSAGSCGQLGPVVKIGRRVRYHASHIQALAEGRTRRGSLQSGKSSPSAQK